MKKCTKTQKCTSMVLSKVNKNKQIMMVHTEIACNKCNGAGKHEIINDNTEMKKKCLYVFFSYSLVKVYNSKAQEQQTSSRT